MATRRTPPATASATPSVAQQVQAAPPPRRPTLPLLRPIALTLLATVALGTAVSVIRTSAETTAFRSRLPASTLNSLERDRAFPIPSLPYFADKRNFFNQNLVKLAWLWTTLLYALHSLSTLASPSTSSTPQRISLNPYTSPITLFLTSTRRYVISTLYWYYLTQRTWFGLSYPSIAQTILRHTGATCIPSSMSSLSDSSNPLPICVGAKGEYWKGGHDVSGHIFMLVHSTLFLYSLIAPQLPKLFPSWYKVAVHPNNASSTATVGYVERTPLPVVVTTYATIGLIAVWWWMLAMTSLYFHTPAEKASGFVFGVLGWFVAGL